MISFKAMILAAGYGTRLRPLTLARPKVLAPLQNRPLLHWLIDYLLVSGAESIVVNAHHVSELLVDYLEAQDFGIPVEVRIEKEIMGTGGGIRNVSDFWDDRPFVVVNGDVITSIDIQQALKSHAGAGAVATLVLADDLRFNKVRVTQDGRVLSFTGGPGPLLTFTGVQVLTPLVLSHIPVEIASSIIECYIQLIASGYKVMAHVVENQFWRELGALDGYLQVHQELFHMQKVPVPGLQVNRKAVVHPSARLGSGVRLGGMVSIGARCTLHDGAVVENSVLWDQVQVKEGCLIRDSIVGDRVIVQESVNNAVVVS